MSDAQSEQARALWFRGVAAFRAGDYEAARLAFSECYEILPRTDVLRNLSLSEVRSGQPVSAARHLTQLLAIPAGDLPADVREEANARLAEAEAQIGQLQVAVDVVGAQIVIDGVVVGRSPLPGKWYIEPGQHEIKVSRPGYPTEVRQVTALPGVVMPVDVSLEALRRERVAIRQPSAVSLPEGAETTNTAGGAEPRVLGAERRGVGAPAVAALVTGGVLAATGLAAGLFFSASAQTHDADGDAIANRLSAVGCSESAFALECGNLRESRRLAARDRQRATGGFVGFAVASAAVLGYGLVLALDDEHATDTARLAATLSVGPAAAWVGLQGDL